MRTPFPRIGHLAAAVALCPATLAAQTVVSGRVMSESNAPLPDVSVSIPAYSVGAYTNHDGQYQFTVPASRTGTATLSARRIGYAPQAVTITLGSAVTQAFTLRATPSQLEGIVVSALGEQREKSQLGTAQQQITSADLTQTKAMNLVQQIQGKVSGVQITGSGTQGGSTNVIIRGANTFTGNNQPLFIVDGVPVSNFNRNQGTTTATGNGSGALTATGGLGNGYDFGNAISDLNPDDIETFTVLKGPNAAAIYGSRGSNGVVVITTKKGAASQGKVNTEIASTYSFDQLSRLPDFQNSYGQGAGGQFKYVNGAGKGTNDNADQSWGPRLDGRLIDQFTGKQQPWIAHPDNVADFFNTGHTSSTTLAASGGTERASARLSVGVDNVEGIIPNNYFHKLSGLLSGGLQINPRFNTSATLQYVRNNGKNRTGTGYNGSVLEQFFWFGRQVDIDALRNYGQTSNVNGGPAGREYNWNYNFHNNPFWLQDENPETDTRDRFIASAQGTYRIADWLNASVRSGADIFKFDIDQRYAVGNGNALYVNPAYNGGFNFVRDYNNEQNTEALLNANRSLTERLAVTGMVGGAIRREQYRSEAMQTTGLSVAGIYNVANAAITPTLAQFNSRRSVNSTFGSASFTWSGWWTVEGTARNDWSSTLPKGANSYFYPSVNTSVILTDAVPALKSNALSYLKLRGSAARVGADANPYQLLTTFTGNPNKVGGLPQFTLGNTLAEANLKPELTTAREAGLEAGFLDSRVTVDASIYDKETRNQIYLVPVSSAGGFATKLLNAGRMQNKGVEALVTINGVRAHDFTWTSTLNFARNRNLVAELAPGVTRILLQGSLFGEMNLYAETSHPYGAIYGIDFARDEQGRPLIQNGVPIAADTMTYLGSIQPQWTGGVGNQFTYKKLSLNVLFDVKHGGKILSYTNYIGDYSGVLKSSLVGREVDYDKPGYIAKGIDVDTDKENTKSVTSETYFQGLFGIISPYVYDASFVKLREVRFGVDLPQRFASRLGANAVSLAVTGRNLAMWTKVPNIDPEFAYSSAASQGVEYAIPANPRSVGLSVRVTP